LINNEKQNEEKKMKICRFSLFNFLAIAALFLFQAGTSFAQTGPCATVIGPDLPDLIVDGAQLKAQMYVTEETFSAAGCTVQEGCVTAPGTHLLLRFMSSTPNIGKADLFIGDPTKCLSGLFRFSECHQHLHFEEYSDYRLWTVRGYEEWVANRDLTQPTNSGKNAKLLAAAQKSGDLLVGRKQGFCIIDILPYGSGANDTIGGYKYRSCNFQGLQVGWADQYVPLLSCQFIQVTDVKEGIYVLEDHVNPEQLLPESDYTNNASAVRIYFKPKQGRSGPSVQVQ
jgi:hypothetical protein